MKVIYKAPGGQPEIRDIPNTLEELQASVGGYESITGEALDCAQVIVPVDGDVYVAVDEEDESEISVDLDFFDT